MSENFEENVPIKDDSVILAGQLSQPPAPMEGEPPKQSFIEEMKDFGNKFSLDSFTECKDLPGHKNVRAGVGINLPQINDGTKVNLGVDARVSLFSTPQGTKITKGIEPSLRITQNLAKDAKFTARLSPSPYEHVNIGVQINF